MYLLSLYLIYYFFFFSSRRRHTRCALVTGVQTCALPISPQGDIVRLSGRKSRLRDRIRQAPIGRGGGAGGSAYGAVFHGSSRLNDRRARHAIRRISPRSRSSRPLWIILSATQTITAKPR